MYFVTSVLYEITCITSNTDKPDTDSNPGVWVIFVYMHISVQLLASLLHFVIVIVSALMVSAVQIQMMDRLKGCTCIQCISAYFVHD